MFHVTKTLFIHGVFNELPLGWYRKNDLKKNFRIVTTSRFINQPDHSLSEMLESWGRWLGMSLHTAKQSSEVEVDVCEYSFYHPGLTYLMNIFIYFAIDKTDPDPLGLLTYCMKHALIFLSTIPKLWRYSLSRLIYLFVYSVCCAEAKVCIYAHACRCQKTGFVGFSSDSFPPLPLFDRVIPFDQQLAN